MSNRRYNSLWKNVVTDLRKQLELEGEQSPDTIDPDAPKAREKKVTIPDAFRHFARLYINYVQIMNRLEKCHDGMIQPQKRKDVEMMLELVISCVVELRHQMVKWCPPNPDVRVGRGQAQPPFPWEYIHLGEILEEMNVPPGMMEISIPRLFRESNESQHRRRDALVQGYMKLKIGVDSVPVEEIVPIDSDSESDDGEDIDENAVQCQSHSGKCVTCEPNSYEVDSGSSAATHIQSLVRRVMAKRRSQADREVEYSFIGMMSPRKVHNDTEGRVQDSLQGRKQEQAENKNAYEMALIDLKNVVRDEESYEIIEKLQEERNRWITDKLALTKDIPGSLDEFYATKDGLQENKDGPDPGKEKSAMGKKKKKGEGSTSEGTGKRTSAKRNAEVEIEVPLLHRKSQIVNELSARVTEYDRVWQNCIDSPKFPKGYDAEMAKDMIVRKQVEEELRKEVDEKLELSLKKIMALHGSDETKTKKSKGASKTKKKKTVKPKKGKGKKAKPLPGEKLPDMKDMDTDHMLSILIENGVINNARGAKLQDFVGAEDFTSCDRTKAGRTNDGRWTPRDPTTAQLRSAIASYCILPQGSISVKNRLDEACNVRSIMLYGPSKSGKTFMAEAIASELGALFINLSPIRLEGRFKEKEDPTKLIHMAFTVATDPAYAPVIIYIDECERIFQSDGKNKKQKKPASDKYGPTRFQKDLLKYKNQCLQKHHQVLIVGSSKHPEKADVKLLKWKGNVGPPEKQGFFERFLYLPYPDHADRTVLWKRFMHEKIGNRFETLPPPLKIDFSTIAFVSEGLTSGMIKECVDDVLSASRVRMLTTQPLEGAEVLEHLKGRTKCMEACEENRKRFMDFTRVITGLEERRKMVEASKSTGGAGKRGPKTKGTKKK